jgi:hypothetical protein
MHLVEATMWSKTLTLEEEDKESVKSKTTTK